MSECDDAVLALLERAKDADLGRVPESGESGVDVGASARLSPDPTDRHGHQRGDAEADRIASDVDGHRADCVGGGLQIRPLPTRQDDVVNDREQALDVLAPSAGGRDPGSGLAAGERQPTSETHHERNGSIALTVDGDLERPIDGRGQREDGGHELVDRPATRPDDDAETSPYEIGADLPAGFERVSAGRGPAVAGRLRDPDTSIPARSLIRARATRRATGSEPSRTTPRRVNRPLGAR